MRTGSYYCVADNVPPGHAIELFLLLFSCKWKDGVWGVRLII
jgi:hypothetical protein